MKIVRNENCTSIHNENTILFKHRDIYSLEGIKSVEKIEINGKNKKVEGRLGMLMF